MIQTVQDTSTTELLKKKERLDNFCKPIEERRKREMEEKQNKNIRGDKNA